MNDFLYSLFGVLHQKTAGGSVVLSSDLLNLRKFTSNGTYTKPNDLVNALVILIGGGAGRQPSASTGERRDDTNYSWSHGSSNGGSAGSSIRFFNDSDLPNSLSVTIGSGGDFVSSGSDTDRLNNSANGGSSSFGSFMTATGGEVVFIRQVTSFATTGTVRYGVGYAPIGGTASGGDINLNGTGEVRGFALADTFLGTGAQDLFDLLPTYGGGGVSGISASDAGADGCALYSRY